MGYINQSAQMSNVYLKLLFFNQISQNEVLLTNPW